MKRLLTILLLLVAVSCHAADVEYILRDAGSNVLSNRKCLITPVNITNSSGGIVTIDPRMFTSDSAGIFYYSNQISGIYQGDVQAPPAAFRFRVYIPDTNVLLYAHQWLTAPTNNGTPAETAAWSISSSDLRYLLIPTNNNTASDNQVASKTGDKTKWITGASTTGPFTNVSIWNDNQTASATLKSTNNQVSLTFQGTGGGNPSGTLRLTSGGFDIGSSAFSGGNITAGAIAGTSFSGDGSALTALNASQLTSGTVTDARLSSNIPLKDAANTFSAVNTFSRSGYSSIQMQGTTGPAISSFGGNFLDLFETAGGLRFVNAANSVVFLQAVPDSTGNFQRFYFNGDIDATNIIANISAAKGIPIDGDTFVPWCPVPPVLYQTFWAFTTGIDGATATNIISQLVANGMNSAVSGGLVFLVDAGWQTSSRDGSGWLQVNTSKWPQGSNSLFGMGQYLHSLNMKFGIYTSASTNDTGCGGTSATTDQWHVSQDVSMFAAFGADFVKVDGCGAFGGPTISGAGNLEYNEAQVATLRFASEMSRYTNHWFMMKAFTPNSGSAGPVYAKMRTYANAWEDGTDSASGSVSGAVYYAFQVFTNNVLGQMGHYAEATPMESASMTAGVSKAVVGSGAILGTLLQVGFTNASLLPYQTNREIFRILQDSSVFPPSLVQTNSSLTAILQRPLGNGTSNAVWMVNWSATNVTLVYQFSNNAYMPSNTAVDVRDAWGQADLGMWTNTFSTNLAAGDSVMFVCRTVSTNNAFNGDTVFARSGFDSFHMQGNSGPAMKSFGGVFTLIDGTGGFQWNNNIGDTALLNLTDGGLLQTHFACEFGLSGNDTIRMQSNTGPSFKSFGGVFTFVDGTGGFQWNNHAGDTALMNLSDVGNFGVFGTITGNGSGITNIQGAWRTNGNTGTDPQSFIGTTDATDFKVKAGGSLVGYFDTNNSVWFGKFNTNLGTANFIGGGLSNSIGTSGGANGSYNTIQGGLFNSIGTHQLYDFIGGGFNNVISNNASDGGVSAIFAGQNNSLGNGCLNTSILWGNNNQAYNTAISGAVGGSYAIVTNQGAVVFKDGNSNLRGSMRNHAMILAFSGGVDIIDGPLVVSNTASIRAGSGGQANVGGDLKVNTTTTGNVAGGEDNLITYSVPASTLSANGQYIEYDCWGYFTNNANAKDLKIYFGSTAIFDSTALVLNGVAWRGHGKVVRTGAATQTATCEFTIGGTLLGAVTTTTTQLSSPAETLSGAVTFKVTGTDSGVSPVDNSIVQVAQVIKWGQGQ